MIRWRSNSATRAPAYFGRWLRRVRVVPIIEIEEQLEAVLDSSEITDLLSLDLLRAVVHEQPKQKPQTYGWPWKCRRSLMPTTYDEQSGAPSCCNEPACAPPVAAGARIDPEAQALAESLRVAVVKDGAETG